VPNTFRYLGRAEARPSNKSTSLCARPAHQAQDGIAEVEEVVAESQIPADECGPTLQKYLSVFFPEIAKCL